VTPDCRAADQAGPDATNRSTNRDPRKLSASANHSAAGFTLRSHSGPHYPVDRGRSTWLTALTLVYAASLPWDLYPVALGKSPAAVSGVVLIVAWLFTQLQNGGVVPAAHHRIFALLFVYWLWMLATGLWSYSISATITELSTMTAVLLLALVLSDTLKTCWRAALAWVATSSVPVALSVIARPSNPLEDGRATSVGIDANVTAMSLACGFAICLFFYLRPGRFKAARTLAIAGVTLTAGAVLHTGSRSGAAALVVTTCLGALLATSKRDLRYAAAGITVASLIALREVTKAGWVPPRVFHTWADIQGGNDAGRGQIWGYYTEHFGDWALRGVGLGSDASYLQSRSGNYYNVHNLLGKTWVELGVVGLTLLLVCLFQVVRRIGAAPTREAVLLLLGPLSVFAWTLGGQSSNIFWFVIALVLVAPNNAVDAIIPTAPHFMKRVRKKL
jgi:O-Antigen ligase